MKSSGNSEIGTHPETANPSADRWLTPGGIPVSFHAEPFLPGRRTADPRDLWLHQEHARLSLLRGFDELLCLEGLHGVEHLPHQIETVRKVLRHFRGRVLLADEVGLGKTIEACLLLREYLLRGMARRVLILVPAPLVSQWHEELSSKFDLDFTVPAKGVAADRAEFWTAHDRVLASLAFVKAKKRAAIVAAQPWDLVIVDEAHHCKNRATLNWQLVNSLQRRFMFLLSATPVQNNLLELYNLLTLLVPGHLRTESDFKKQYVKRGNPRDALNRERLRSLLGEVMVRNTRSLVQINLPPRYAQTVMAKPDGAEAELYRKLTEFLRSRGSGLVSTDRADRRDGRGRHGGDRFDRPGARLRRRHSGARFAFAIEQPARRARQSSGGRGRVARANRRQRSRGRRAGTFGRVDRRVREGRSIAGIGRSSRRATSC